MRITKQIKKKSMALLTVVCLLAGSMSVLAASDDTDNNEEISAQSADGGVLCDDGYIEYTEYPSADNDDDIIYIGTIDNTKGSGTINNWSIATGHSATSVIFKANSGGTISIAVNILPVNKTVKVGIVQPNGVKRYVEGSGSVGHDFSLTQTGNYKVYIANESGTTVTANGSYVY